MILQEIVTYLENQIPLQLQEDYDNSGLVTGDRSQEISSCLLCVDVTLEVIQEAIDNNHQLIISHHPLVFGGLKSLTGRNMVEKCIIKAIRNQVAIYCMHTNIDNVFGGVSFKMAEKLELQQTKVLVPKAGILNKIVTFVPNEHAEQVRKAMFEAGAGHIGNYDSCSYNINGQGSFRGGENTNPFVGQKGELHFEPEVRVETIVPAHKLNYVVQAMFNAHPYEEVAYDVYPLLNKHHHVGIGCIGFLKDEMPEEEFLRLVKEKFQCKGMRTSPFIKRNIKKIALCGGSGSSFLRDALRLNADAYISGDFKYHQFFEAENKILIADIGHFESEQYTIEIFYELLTKKFTNFAVYFTRVNTNPINYF